MNKATKKPTFQPGWRRWTTDSDAPVTLPKAPWEQPEIEKDSDERHSAPCR